MLQQRLVALLGKCVTLRTAGDRKVWEGILGRRFLKGREIWTVTSADGKELCHAEASSIYFVEGVEGSAP